MLATGTLTWASYAASISSASACTCIIGALAAPSARVLPGGRKSSRLTQGVLQARAARGGLHECPGLGHVVTVCHAGLRFGPRSRGAAGRQEAAVAPALIAACMQNRSSKHVLISLCVSSPTITIALHTAHTLTRRQWTCALLQTHYSYCSLDASKLCVARAAHIRSGMQRHAYSRYNILGQTAMQRC